MQPLLGLPIHKPYQVCKLQRSLYGLKQAGRQWYDKLSTFLLSNNYIRSNAEHYLFLKLDTCHTIAILIYVDDIVLSGKNDTEILQITYSLDNLFHIKIWVILLIFSVWKSLGIVLAFSSVNENTPLIS